MKWFLAAFVGLGLLILAACSTTVPTMDQIRDSRFFDRRIEETPRQRTIRECKQESDRFRISCKHCHTTEDEAKIQSPGSPLLTEIGKRAQIMRTSPTFGLHTQCSECHQSKFKLTSHAETLFGPGGSKHKELEKEMQEQTVK
ncbi:MAG: hypothetical protein HY291_23240 [Planctomycetes bacterium]|nr:hypothetical protein [Planctomycetota bacterium]